MSSKDAIPNLFAVLENFTVMSNRQQPFGAQQFVMRKEAPVATIRLNEALLRQKTIIFLSTVLGCCLAWLYYQHTPVRYVSKARVMVNQRDAGLVRQTSTASHGEDLVNEDVLANHIELLSSRKNVSKALERAGLSKLPSIVSQLDDDQDAIDYVIDHLALSRGGEGPTKAARTVHLQFEHTNSTDAMLVLECVVQEYMHQIEKQFEDSLAIANSVVIESQKTIQQDLKKAQREYIDSRRNASVLFTGEGSSNVFVEQFKSLNNQLLEIEIEESTTQARLQKATGVLETYADESVRIPIDALGVIDTDSLQRLGVFANMRADSTRTVDFQMNQPERHEEARAQYNQLLSLMLEKKRLEADFGLQHPDVKNLQEEIDLVNVFLEQNAVETDAAMDEPQLTSRQLLGAYVGFLKSELASLRDRREQHSKRIKSAEVRARSLVDFELQDQLLRSQIDRNQQLFDGLVEQLRTLNMASSVDGYIHEILETPRPGIKVWPKRSIVGAAGLMLGLLAGLFAALVNDQLNTRFHTAEEMDSTVALPVLAYVDRLPVSHRKMCVSATAAESESFRMLRTTLLSDVRAGRLCSLTATSASPGDGKSTVLMNLAASFASLDMSVVIVEADMRRPTFRKRLQIKNEHGLSGLLSGSVSLEDAISESAISSLKIIHAGAAVGNPSELLESESFEALLKELRTQFSLIIVDVGPILTVSDSLVVAQKVDGAMLVVRPSVDTRQQVIGAVNALNGENINLLGMIVNAYGSSKQFRAGRYGYSSTYRPLVTADQP